MPKEMILPRIVVDTREQYPYMFEPRATIVKKLDTGDYSLEGFEDKVAVERKQMDEFISCMINKKDHANRARFERELERAKEMHRLWIIVEGDFKDIIAGAFRSLIKVKCVIATILAWLNRYPVAIIFSFNRKYSSRITLRILERSYSDFIENKV